MSPSARTSKGFLICRTRVVPSVEQFKTDDFAAQMLGVEIRCNQLFTKHLEKFKRFSAPDPVVSSSEQSNASICILIDTSLTA